MNNNYTFSTGSTVHNNIVTCVEDVDIGVLHNFFNTPIESEVDINVFGGLSKKDRNKIKCGLPYWTGAFYTKSLRREENLTHRNLFTGDIDYASDEYEKIISVLESMEVNYFIHSSISYNPSLENYKYRVVIPLDDDICSDSDYRFICDDIISRFDDCSSSLDATDGSIFDIPASRTMNRALFAPCSLKNGEYIYNSRTNIKDFCVSLSLAENKGSAHKDEKTVKTKPMLPCDIPGVEGAFNRAYTARDIMIEFSDSDTYAEGEGGRWTYRLGSTSNGIRFYEDDMLLHSDHASDPLNKKQWSAFDLYTFFEFDNNSNKSINHLYSEPKIQEILKNEFAGLESKIEKLSENKVTHYLSPGDLKKIRNETNPAKSIENLVKYTYLMPDKKGTICFVLPCGRVDYFGEEKREFLRLSIGKLGIDAFFGNLGVITDPQNPKKGLTPSEYIIKYSKSIKVYLGFAFTPYNPYKSYERDFCNEEYGRVNTFSGYNGIDPNFGFKDNKKAMKAIKFIQEYILNVICNSDTEAYAWVIDWIADVFQNPEDRKGTALILYSSDKGTGKTSLHEAILKPLLGINAITLEGKRLGDKFNAPEKDLLIGCYDDISYQAKKDSGDIRNLITSESRMIEEKHSNGYSQRIYTRYIFTSNHKQVADIDAQSGERRFTILEVNSSRKGDMKFWEKLRTCAKCYRSELLAYFLTHEIKSDLRNPYYTSLYNEIKYSCLSPVDEFFTILFSSLDDALTLFNDEDDFTVSQVTFLSKEFLYIKKKTLYEYFKDNFKGYNYTSHLFKKDLNNSSYIQKHGVEYDQMKTGYRCTHRFSGKSPVSAFRLPVKFFSQ